MGGEAKPSLRAPAHSPWRNRKCQERRVVPLKGPPEAYKERCFWSLEYGQGVLCMLVLACAVFTSQVGSKCSGRDVMKGVFFL